MMAGVDIQDIIVLEPSAGSGAIIDFLKESGVKEVICCENNPDLLLIAAKKGRLIAEDFLSITSDMVSHIDLVVANPPFSDDESHILHMWEIAPGGCEIITLCNYNTYEIAHTRERRVLKSVIDKNGSIQNLGSVFGDAERTTDAEIGLVRLNKPKSQGEDEFQGYFDLNEEFEHQENGLMGFNEIRSIVNRYVGAVKMFNEVMEANKRINGLIEPIKHDLGLEFGAHMRNHYGVVDRDAFKKELQKAAWRTVFGKMNMRRYTTKSVMNQLNKFIEKQQNGPFTMKNIFKMIEVIVGTHGDRMKRVLVEIFDWLTDHHYDNRRAVPGWKTNSMYFVDKKFIAPYCGIGKDYGGHPEIRWSSSGEKIDELVKALCFLTGYNYNNFTELHEFFRPKKMPNDKAEAAIKELAEVFGISERAAGLIHMHSRYAAEISNDKYYRRFWDLTTPPSRDELDRYKAFYERRRFSEDCWGEKYESKEWGQWLDWGFFQIKVFKKGTLHAKFKDEKVWEMFNRACAEAKGWRLPTKTGSDVRRKGTEVEVL
jgi:hypothetical protein